VVSVSLYTSGHICQERPDKGKVQSWNGRSCRYLTRNASSAKLAFPIKKKGRSPNRPVMNDERVVATNADPKKEVVVFVPKIVKGCFPPISAILIKRWWTIGYPDS